MDKEPQSRFTLPNEESWAELRLNLRLSDVQADALHATLREAEGLCRELAADLAKSEVKRSLLALDRLLSNAHRGLQRGDIRQALASIEMHGALSALLSREAGAEIHGENSINELAHDRLLNERTHEAMSYVLEKMRRPIADWLALAALDKGGSRPKSDRQVLILLLARDSSQIIGTKPSTAKNGPFHLLCSWVCSRCGIADDGLEEAMTRCLKRYKKWLVWKRLPSGHHVVGQLSDAEIADIDDDPEEEFSS